MNENIKQIKVFGLYDTPTMPHQAGSVYNINGLSPSIDTCGGGNRMPIIVYYERKHKTKNKVRTDK